MEFMVLDTDLTSIDVLDTYSSMIWTDRYYTYGDFEIYTELSLKNFQMLQKNRYIQSSESDHLMIIETRKTETDAEDGNWFLVSGRSLESILDRRIVWEQTILDGYLESQYEKILNQNIINPKDSNRKIPNFIFKKSGDSRIEEMKIQAQYTGDNLLELTVAICKERGIGFSITLNDITGNFEFQFYMGEDRSYDQILNPYVVFSPSFENIVNSNYRQSNVNLKTIALVAGEDQGSNRKTTTVDASSDKPTGINRRELYVDARDLSSDDENGNSLSNSNYIALLKKRGEEKLLDYKESNMFDGQVETTVLYRYEEDFFMGDLVQLEDEFGTESKSRIVEYIYSEDQKGINYYPTFDIIEED